MPAGHEAQLLLPVPAANVPSWQGRHSTAPDPLANLPLSQSLHWVTPAVAEAVPG